MNKLTQFFSNLKTWLVILGTGTIAVLAYVLNLKNKELEANKSKIDLLQDQKEADALESQINQRLAEEQLNEKGRQGLQQSLDLLNQKRDSLKDPRTTDKDKEEYWNGKK